VIAVTVTGLGHGPIPASQIFGGGTPAVIGGRRAAIRRIDPASCAGSGASHAVRYAVDDGQ